MRNIIHLNRELALLIIITRAGLELDPAAVRKLGSLIVKLSLVPVAAECSAIAIMTYFLFDLPWIWGFLLG